MNINILIPAYEPDEKLTALLEKLLPHYAVTVVDDGSSEHCAPVFSKAEALGAKVLHHEVNRGKGAALKTGVRALMNEGTWDGIVTADADGQHTPEDISRMAAAMEEHPDTLILGGRDFSHMPARSRAGNTISRFFFRLATGLSVSDTQTGLRALPKCLYEKLLTVDGDRYEYEMNMLLALRDWGSKYLEIPIETVYLEGNRSSHFHAVRDGLRVFSRVIKYALSSLTCTLVDYLIYILLLTVLPTGTSYAIARLCSATLNYFVNLKAVFHGKATAYNALGYVLLSAFSLAVGSVVSSLLANAGLGKIIAKMLIDLVMFFFNYVMQNKVIFKKREKEEK